MTSGVTPPINQCISCGNEMNAGCNQQLAISKDFFETFLAAVAEVIL